jgi:16S rRNA processing protein RimM
MIVLGRIVAPFGIQGWVKIHPFGDDPLSWCKMPRWWVCPDSEGTAENWRPLTPRGCRMQGKALVAAFAEVADRDAAEALGGLYVGAPREALPAPAVDEYYWADLVGLSVANRAGEVLGTVSGLLSTGAHDVLQVGNGEAERLIPFVAAYVDEVDLGARLIRVDWDKDW